MLNIIPCEVIIHNDVSKTFVFGTFLFIPKNRQKIIEKHFKKRIKNYLHFDTFMI